MNAGRTGTSLEGKNAKTTMAELDQMLRRRIASRTRIDADRADTRPGVEVDDSKGQAA